MAQGTLPPNPNSSDPYEQLGITADATFEQVQAAKQNCLNQIKTDDALGRARVETAYDSVLMQRLKERQLGQLTGAAATASKREAASNAAPAAPALPRLAVLQNLPRPKLQWQQPSIKLAEEKQLWWPLGGHGLLLLLLLVVGNQLGTPELLLALASLLTIGALQRRRSRLFTAVGLTIAALAVGLLIGSLISAGSSLPIGEAQFAAVPALLLLAATAVLFD
jgi:hypothetical protein